MGDSVGCGFSVGCGVGDSVGKGVDELVGVGVGVLVGAGVAVGQTVDVAVGAIVGCSVGDCVTTAGLSDTILIDSLDGVFSIVNPKPTVLVINAKADIPANVKRFLAGFFRSKFMNAHNKKIGMHNKLMQNSKRNKLFMVNPPFFFCFHIKR